MSVEVKAGDCVKIKSEFFAIPFIEHTIAEGNIIGKSNRPYFVASVENDVCWVAPLSSKVDKYSHILESISEKTNQIIISENNKSAILLQNILPVNKKYIKEIIPYNILSSSDKTSVFKAWKIYRGQLDSRLCHTFYNLERLKTLSKSDFCFFHQLSSWEQEKIIKDYFPALLAEKNNDMKAARFALCPKKNRMYHCDLVSMKRPKYQYYGEDYVKLKVNPCFFLSFQNSKEFIFTLRELEKRKLKFSAVSADEHYRITILKKDVEEYNASVVPAVQKRLTANKCL